MDEKPQKIEGEIIVNEIDWWNAALGVFWVSFGLFCVYLMYHEA
jgi:hypothetical protein